MEGGGIFSSMQLIETSDSFLHAIMYLPRADFFHITCPNSKGEWLESELGFAHIWQVLQDAAELGCFEACEWKNARIGLLSGEKESWF